MTPTSRASVVPSCTGRGGIGRGAFSSKRGTSAATPAAASTTGTTFFSLMRVLISTRKRRSATARVCGAC